MSIVEFKVPQMSQLSGEGRAPDILFWVGCAGSYDARAQKVTVAFCKLLNKAGVEFAILGKEENCTGDPARRSGNEFLFQMSALQNIETLKMYNVRKVVTTCPHCFNTLKNEYPDLGSDIDVQHHTEFLLQLVKDGKIDLSAEEGGKVTYHDSCYLGRINDIYEAPRTLIKGIARDLVEMPRAGKTALCCGAGGAQMFKEEEQGSIRVNEERANEVIDSGAQKVIANCPFCITMLEDGLKAREKQDDIKVYDLSEYILNNIK